MKTKKNNILKRIVCPPYSGAGVVVVSRHVEGDDGAMEGLPRLTPVNKVIQFYFKKSSSSGHNGIVQDECFQRRVECEGFHLGLYKSGSASRRILVKSDRETCWPGKGFSPYL
jgi:hypothetical protein